MAQRCSHCGQITMVRRRNLRRELVQALRKAALFKRPFMVREIPGLSRGGYADFTKLKYWGLIEAVPDSERWRITAQGFGFLEGWHAIEKYKWVYNDRIQDQPVNADNPLVNADSIDPAPPTIHTVRQNSMTVDEHHATNSGDLFK